MGIMEELPEEITYTPVPYIALVGLDVINNANHTHIWNTFAINRGSDRPLLYYKLIPDGYKFPPSKAKKTIERHTVNGIIKRKWLPKHLVEMPSIIAIFQEGGWDLLQNEERKTNCFAVINSIRANLVGRQIKIVLILTQPVNITDDDHYKENSVLFCNECDINPKHFFMMSTNDHQMIANYVMRVESSFLELSKSYYTTKVKMIKSQKDLLNRATQIYLFVRYEFKLGFFHEIRQIYNTALEHYKNSYTALMEIRQSTSNIFEIKSVASLLNYKICRLCFYLNNPKDAISYFKNHIEIFQNKFVSNQIEFEHYGWLSKQFRMFAELFDMAVNFFNLIPTSNHHPGIYYFESATYLVKRRNSSKLFNHLKKELNADSFDSNVNDAVNVEFIGHSLFVQGSDENTCFKALQYKEQFVDHTTLIIELYVNVLNHFKKFKKPRFRNYLMFLIGEEYYNLANYTEALTYFNNILPFYREQKWDNLYNKVVQLSMNTAYLTTDLDNFIKCAFECMLNKSLSDLEKHKLLNCVFTLLNLQSKPLQLFEHCDEHYNQYMEQRWSESLENIVKKNSFNDIIINMDKGFDFFECKVAFSSQTYFIEDVIDIKLLIYSHLLIDIENVKFILKFQNPRYDNLFLLLVDQKPVIKAKLLNEFHFQLRALLEDIGKELLVSELILRADTKFCLSFHWPFSKRSKFIKPSAMSINDNKELKKFQTFSEQTCTKILEHESKLAVSLNKKDVFYVNEFALLQLKIESLEKYAISNLKCDFKVNTSTDKIDCKLYHIENDQLCEIIDKHVLTNSLGSNETLHKDIYVKLFSIGNKSIEMLFTYDLLFELDDKTRFILVNKRTCWNIKSKELFTSNSTISNWGNLDTANIRLSEPFRLKVDLNIEDEDDIEIENLTFSLADNVSVLSHDTNNHFPCLMSHKLTEHYVLSSQIESPSFPLGFYTIQWMRKVDSLSKQMLISETVFQLPSIAISSSHIFIELEIPDQIYAREPFMAKYIIHNRFDVDIIAEVSMDMSDDFMTSGNKLVKRVISSKSFTEQTYIYFPLRCGSRTLPRLGVVIHLPGQNQVVIDYVNQMICSTINILPQLRKSVEL